MRLFLLPVSTRRTLLYAQRLNGTAGTAKPQGSLVDKTTAWAAKKWAQWEKKESGWQRKVVDYGNHAFRRIPYQEWGLKSVPARRRDDQRDASNKVELVFPARALGVDQAPAVALKLATERLGLHRQKMIWCFVGMPITVPFALIPIIPNLPFFYLVYRAWSHWRAIVGGRHLQWLVENKLVLPSPSAPLDQLYSKDAPLPKSGSPAGQEKMLLTQKQVRSFSETLNVPELEIELERAIWQVERELETERPSSKSSAKTRQEGKGAEVQEPAQGKEALASEEERK